MTSDQYFLAITAIQNRLHAYILSLLADPVAGQDVLQETNLVLIRKADDFQSGASFESWAYNTARFQVLAHLRDRKRDRLVLHEAFAEKLAPVAEVMAVRASASSPTVDSADYEVAAFESAWPVNSGVLQTRGSIRFVSPGPDFHPGNYEDNEHIVVFPERHAVTPDESIRVDMVDPGEYVKSRYREKRVLPSGRRVASYLLQFDAFPTGPFPNRKRSVRGQITFAKPIVGVITETRLLKESEAIFGNPDVEYPTPRAVETRPEGDVRPGFDSVILAADQRTLILDLKVAPQKLDQLRVLVEAE